jgi:hypothetical protein
MIPCGRYLIATRFSDARATAAALNIIAIAANVKR